MFELKPLSREAIPAALEKAIHYRLLNETQKLCTNRYDRAEHKHSGNENRSPCWLAVAGTAKAAAAEGFRDWMHQASAAL